MDFSIKPDNKEIDSLKLMEWQKAQFKITMSQMVKESENDRGELV